jgi:L-fuconolactonase
MTKMDAHQHFWNPARGDYHWMPKDHPVLGKAYGPHDIVPLIEACGITKTILVQAAQSIGETEYLLGIADATPSVMAVVGWIDFENREHLRQLQRLANHPKFAGVRPMIQDIADDNWMLRADVQWGFSALADLGLTFDALGFPRHLSNFQTIFERYPQLHVVVDHCMKPQVGKHGAEDAGFAFWAAGMARIAQDTGAFCKLSGLVTEAGDGWTVDTLRPYAAHVLSIFGAERVMWGSDWPVCLLQASYAQWHDAALELCGALCEADKAKVFGETALAFYGRR